jgi:hypothetical protein
MHFYYKYLKTNDRWYIFWEIAIFQIFKITHFIKERIKKRQANLPATVKERVNS